MAAKETRNTAELDDTINLVEMFGVLWAGKLWIFGAMFLALALGAFMTLRAERIYQANALIQLETRSGALALPAGMQELLGGESSGAAAVETETEILKSRMVVGEAVRELDQQIKVAPTQWAILGNLPRNLSLPDPGWGILSRYEWGNEALELTEFEVPDRWLGTEMNVTLTGDETFSLALPDGSVHPGRARERLALPDLGVSLVVSRADGPVGREFTILRVSVPEAVKDIQENLTVAGASRNSSILRLSFKDGDPRLAERLLDAITQAYVSQNIARSAAEADNSLGFIEEQLPIAQQEVAKAQQVLNAYRQQQNSVDVDFETRSLLERATAVEAELTQLVLQEDELKKRYTVNHPTYELLLEKRKALEEQLEGLRAETSNLPETQKEIFNLTRDLEVAQEAYVQLLNRSQELRVVRASTVGSVRVIDSAYSDDNKISPRTTLTLGVAGIFGALIGVAIVLIRRMLRQGIRGAQDIEQLGLPVFATIGFSPDAAHHRVSKGALPIHAITTPDDVVIESLRSLRTSLHFGMLDAQTNAVMLTSAAPGAGKSFTAVNLAAVAAQAGQKVCLIDADLRRGYLRRYFKKEKGTPGLAEILAHEKTLDEVLVQGPIDGLSVILTGRYPPNPSELLMRAEFQDLLKTLNDRFDLVIIDSPPVLAVTDPVVIARYAGASIMVVRHMETVAGEIEAVQKAFETAKAKLTGAILNGYKAEAGSRYGGYNYNYRYSYKTDNS